eukprot:COSAG04_NODE_110_length_25928_cov_18.966782_11_plen_81_part_00
MSNSSAPAVFSTWSLTQPLLPTVVFSMRVHISKSDDEETAAGGIVYPLYVYPTAANLAGIYTTVAKSAATVPITIIINVK